MKNMKKVQYTITDGVRKFSRPFHVQIGLPPAFNPPTLNVFWNKDCKNVDCFRISRKVAEALIANGMGYED